MNEAFGSIDDFRREVSNLSPLHKAATEEIKGLVEQVDAQKQEYIQVGVLQVDAQKQEYIQVGVLQVDAQKQEYIQVGVLRRKMHPCLMNFS